MSITTTTNWSDPSTCPFCSSAIADPGAGFVAHLEEAPDCASDFEARWTTLASDLAGEWTG